MVWYWVVVVTLFQGGYWIFHLAYALFLHMGFAPKSLASLPHPVGVLQNQQMSGPPGLTSWISIAPVFSFMYTVESLSLLYLLFYISIYMSWEMMHE